MIIVCWFVIYCRLWAVSVVRFGCDFGSVGWLITYFNSVGVLLVFIVC